MGDSGRHFSNVRDECGGRRGRSRRRQSTVAGRPSRGRSKKAKVGEPRRPNLNSEMKFGFPSHSSSSWPAFAGVSLCPPSRDVFQAIARNTCWLALVSCPAPPCPLARPSAGADPAAPRRRKSPWRMSKTRKMRARLRLKGVDSVIAAVESSGVSCHALVRPPRFALSPRVFTFAHYRRDSCRPRPSHYQPRTRCTPRTSTPPSPGPTPATARASTRSPIGRGSRRGRTREASEDGRGARGTCTGRKGRCRTTPQKEIDGTAAVRGAEHHSCVSLGAHRNEVCLGELRGAGGKDVGTGKGSLDRPVAR